MVGEDAWREGFRGTEEGAIQTQSAVGGKVEFAVFESDVLHRTRTDAAEAFHALGTIHFEVAAVAFGEWPFNPEGKDEGKNERVFLRRFLDAGLEFLGVVMDHCFGGEPHFFGHSLAVAENNVIGHQIVKFLNAMIAFRFEQVD